MDDVDSVTILKYTLHGTHSFNVMDKFETDDKGELLCEEDRLDKMIARSAAFATQFGQCYQELWIKTCPIFPTR